LFNNIHEGAKGFCMSEDQIFVPPTEGLEDPPRANYSVGFSPAEGAPPREDPGHVPVTLGLTLSRHSGSTQEESLSFRGLFFSGE
jgi:hypothetical protein